ncbi:transporter substrate-binding domain-containing protein [uncultured Dialister sp.]|uniref:transporter substrate-binding domain-containing protein n=1 Tax=uncultured Dialister sp. TaxID=278064 RepID=UPI0025F98C6A|nr:transporter substrate-binding domain-containing protein [uncultured Dialister sp.]
MNKTMKVILLGTALTAAMISAGCGDSSTSKSSAASGSSQSKLMQTIKQRGKLIVGTSSGYPPYVFVDAESPDKKVIGLDMEMCKQIADKLGVPMEVQDMSFSALLSSVTAGKVDIAVGGVSPTPEREKAMAFSDLYLPTEQKLLVRKADQHKLKTMGDLKGKVIGAEKSTTQEATAQKVEGATAIGLSSVPDAVLQLKNGKLDGIVLEGVVSKQYLVYNDDLALADVQFEGAKKVSAVALQKGNDDVVKIINEVIKQDTESGQFDKWVDEYSKIAIEKAGK